MELDFGKAAPRARRAAAQRLGGLAGRKHLPRGGAESEGRPCRAVSANAGCGGAVDNGECGHGNAGGKAQDHRGGTGVSGPEPQAADRDRCRVLGRDLPQRRGDSETQVRLHNVPLLSADLHFRGFSETRIHPERKQPDTFFYDNVSPTSFWNPTPGLYTRYGDVRELLKDVDDRLAILGSGDEIRLQFSSAPAPPGSRVDARFSIEGGRMGEGPRPQHRVFHERRAAAISRHEPLSISRRRGDSRMTRSIGDIAKNTTSGPPCGCCAR